MFFNQILFYIYIYKNCLYQISRHISAMKVEVDIHLTICDISF